MSHSRLRVASSDSAVVLGPSEVAIIGRAPGCEILVDDGRVSRSHARLTPTADGWLLEDLASTAGTWRADDRITRMLITEPVEVRLADSVSGPLLRLVPEAVIAGAQGGRPQLLFHVSQLRWMVGSH